MIARFRRYRLRRATSKVSDTLTEQFGSKKFYSITEMEEACTLVGVTGKQRELAYAMFSEEEVCNGFLSRIGCSKTARDLRFFAASTLFGTGTTVGYDSLWNRFHDYNDLVVGGIQNTGSFSDSGGAGSGGDDGGGFSDFGGGDGGGGD